MRWGDTAELCWEKVTFAWDEDGVTHLLPLHSCLMGALLALYPSGRNMDKNLSFLLWNMEENVLTMPRIIFGKYQT